MLKMLFQDWKATLGVLLLFSGLLPLFSQEKLSFNDPADWTGGSRLTRLKDGSLAIKGMGILFTTSEAIPMDTSAVATLSGEFKALPGTTPNDRYFFAFLNYDKDMKRIEAYHVNAVKNTFTVVTKGAKKGEKLLTVKNGKAYRKGQYIAPYAKKDFSDLPNREIQRNTTIKEVKMLPSGEALLTLTRPLYKAIPAGTSVRAHNGGWYQYSGAFASRIPKEWKKISVDIKGTAPGNHSRIWRPGTAFVKIAVFGSGKSKTNFLNFRNITLEIKGGKPVVYKGKKAISEKTKAIHIQSPIQPKGDTFILFFKDGSKRTVAVKPGAYKFQHLTLPNAYIEIAPFDRRYAMTSAPAKIPRHKTIKDLEKLWKADKSKMDKEYFLSLRRTSNGVECYFNGSFAGIIRKMSPIIAIAGINGKTSYRQDKNSCEKFLPLDLTGIAKNKTGKTPYLDLAITAGKEAAKDGLNSFRKMKKSFVLTVPARQYPAAKIRFAISPDEEKDPAMTIRLTRYVATAGYRGRAFEGMADTLITYPVPGQKKVGEITLDGKKAAVYEALVPLKTGNIIDLIYWENNATYSMANSRYLDLEILGRCNTFRHPFGDKRMYPNPAKKSAFNLLAISLENPSMEMKPAYCQRGNIFHIGDKAAAKMQFTPLEKGSYTLHWTIKNTEGKLIKKASKAVPAKGGTLEIPLAHEGIGHYYLDFELFKGKRSLLTHEASFAILAKDTRKAGLADSPYGTWDYTGAHYTAGDINVTGPILSKAGFRRSAWIHQKNSWEKRKKWQLGAPRIYASRKWDDPDEKHIAAIRKSMKENPGVKHFMIFHENAKNSYQMAPELTGQKYDPKNAWPDAEKRLKYAMKMGRIIRENFPELKISIGNSLASTELLAEVIRGGFPEKYADYTGLEVVGRNNLPERQWESSIQAAELQRETVRKFGYKWKQNACYESNYRLPALIGEERQALWYTRDLLLSLCWGFPDIFIGVLMDTGNAYAGSFWGASGLCTRNPYIYPRKSYVAIANATRLLDQVTGCEMIPAGDNCVYIAKFTRKDGKRVYALWSSTADTEVELDLALFASCERFDLYGRPIKGSPKKVLVTPAAQYILAGKDIIKGAKVTGYPKEAKKVTLPGDGQLLASLNDGKKWQLKKDKDILLEKPDGLFMPYRTRGEYTLREVNDPVMGKCMELELSKPNYKLASCISEYAVVELKKPVYLSRKPNSVGMMVKGNSGWGQVYFVLEDANGERRISCGTRVHDADVFDYDGRASLSCSSWRAVTMPITAKSSIPDLSTGAVSNLWEYGSMKNGKFVRSSGKFEAPIKVVGVAFAAQNRPLYITERKKMKQVLRFRDLFFFDFDKE